jgi:tetratricopeptide (TPR) repeat protein
MKNRLALLLIFICLLALMPLQRYLDDRHPSNSGVEQVLYLPSGKIVKRLSFGFSGVLADIYWLRSVQYFGRQLLNEKQEFDWAKLATVKLDLLYPLLDITTSLDGNYIEAYRFGSIFLQDYNNKQALLLLKKGIENNPQNWRLYQNLGLLLWHTKDYKSASEAFFKGSELPQAPYWMKLLGGVMLTEGGNRTAACQLYTTFYQEADASGDVIMRSQMEKHLERIEALDEIDYINELLNQYREATDRCPSSLAVLIPTLRADSNRKGSCGQPIKIKISENGDLISPLDGLKYYYDEKNCKALMPYQLDEP